MKKVLFSLLFGACVFLLLISASEITTGYAQSLAGAQADSQQENMQTFKGAITKSGEKLMLYGQDSKISYTLTIRQYT